MPPVMLLAFIILINMTSIVYVNGSTNDQFIEEYLEMTILEAHKLRNTIRSMARAGIENVPHSEKFGPIPIQVTAAVTPHNMEYLGDWEGTAYNPVTSQTDDDPWITASGRRSVPGVSVAVDPEYWLDLLREGAFLYIEGYGVVRVDDTGSKVKGRNRFDLMVANRDIAMQLGRWKAGVWLITD